MESTDYKESNTSATTMTEKEPGSEQPDLEQGKTQTAEISHFYPETDLDRGVVGWEGQDDPANPLNFAPGKKWALLALISAFTFVSPLASSMFSPAVSYMAADFKETDETIISFTVSIYLLGYVVWFFYLRVSMARSREFAADEIQCLTVRAPIPSSAK